MTTTMMTDTLPAGSMLGSARERSMLAGVLSHGAECVTVSVTTATPITTHRADAADVVTNPWLDGFGTGNDTGFGSTSATTGSIKRIHPGRLEGVT